MYDGVMRYNEVRKAHMCILFKVALVWVYM